MTDPPKTMALHSWVGWGEISCVTETNKSSKRGKRNEGSGVFGEKNHNLNFKTSTYHGERDEVKMGENKRKLAQGNAGGVLGSLAV